MVLIVQRYYHRDTTCQLNTTMRFDLLNFYIKILLIFFRKYFCVLSGINTVLVAGIYLARNICKILVKLCGTINSKLTSAQYEKVIDIQFMLNVCCGKSRTVLILQFVFQHTILNLYTSKLETAEKNGTLNCFNIFIIHDASHVR